MLSDARSSSLSSFRVASDLLRLGAHLEQLQVSRNARFRAESREREESGGPLFRWTDVRASTSALPMKGFLWAEPRPHGSIFRA